MIATELRPTTHTQPITDTVTRLDFRLHDFTRWTWVSDRARELWKPRMQKILAAWKEIEWRSVPAGVRSGALVVVPSAQLADLQQQLTAIHLTAVPVQQLGAPSSYSTVSAAVTTEQPFNFLVAIGSLATVTNLKAAWDANQQGEVGRLLGYPTCCQQFYERVWIQERRIDPTWSMALHTTTAHRHDHCCDIHQSSRANMLLRWLGVRSVPHLPCSFDCAATLQQADQFLALGRDLGYGVEMGWLEEMLSWAIEWSALHGIAEIKTPIFKITTLTDATATKCVVRHHGNTAPEACGNGLGFPYASNVRSNC
ncbi:MAG: hypothetical protein ACAF41_28470 [Leptolyngbya sp. BL-A-14]